MPRRKKHSQGNNKNNCNNEDPQEESNITMNPNLNFLMAKLFETCDTIEAKKVFLRGLEDSFSDDMDEMQTICAVMEFVANPFQKQYTLKRLEFEEPPSMDTDDLLEITMLEDDDFWKHFHMMRKTVKMILRDAKNIPKELDACTNEAANGVPLDTTIALSLWYLRNNKTNFTRAVKLFNLPSIEVAEAVLDRGLRLICNLKCHCGLAWPPSEDEFFETSQHISERFKLNNVLGILNYKSFFTEEGEKQMLVVICNEKCMFKAAEISLVPTVRGSEETISMLMRKIRFLPKKYLLLAGEDYAVNSAQELNKRLVTPFSNVDPTKLNYEEAIFNKVHGLILNFGSYPLNEITRRFPRLLNLHRRLPDAIIAACVLHNYCIKYFDQAPFY